MEILHQYQNGNTNVTLYTDGTKERTYEGEPIVDQPETLDVKITNFCLAGCSYCHEKSTKLGQHGDLNILKKVLSELKRGTEISIGGGNALDHPDLMDFLIWAQSRGIVCNITINQKHLNPYKDLIFDIINKQLIRGVGISYTSSSYIKDIIPILEISDNVVFHVIMGINSVSDINNLYDVCKNISKVCKILILGYKQYGFGINYYLKNKGIEEKKYRWYVDLAQFFKLENLVLSFDNLAIDQLNLKRYFTTEGWNKFFMGEEGKFSCYIDAINGEYAMSSTTYERTSFKDSSLLDFFKTLGKINHHPRQEFDNHALLNDMVCIG